MQMVIHIVVQQKQTQHCNEILFQFKNDQIKSYPEQKTVWEAKDFRLISALLFTKGMNPSNLPNFSEDISSSFKTGFLYMLHGVVGRIKLL